MKKRKLYVDVDGVLAEFNKDASIEEITSDGYFLERTPMSAMICAMRTLAHDYFVTEKVEICALSHAITGTSAEQDKMIWLNRFCEGIFNKIIICPYGTKKNDFVSDAKGSILLDDFSKNLTEWEESGGIGIKVYNGINNTHHTWDGFVVNANSKSSVIYLTLKGIILSLANTERGENNSN